MTDGTEHTSSPTADENDEQAEILRKKVALLKGRRREELLEDIDSMLAKLDGAEPAD